MPPPRMLSPRGIAGHTVVGRELAGQASQDRGWGSARGAGDASGSADRVLCTGAQAWAHPRAAATGTPEKHELWSRGQGTSCRAISVTATPPCHRDACAALPARRRLLGSRARRARSQGRPAWDPRPPAPACKQVSTRPWPRSRGAPPAGRSVNRAAQGSLDSRPQAYPSVASRPPALPLSPRSSPRVALRACGGRLHRGTSLASGPSLPADAARPTAPQGPAEAGGDPGYGQQLSSPHVAPGPWQSGRPSGCYRLQAPDILPSQGADPRGASPQEARSPRGPATTVQAPGARSEDATGSLGPRVNACQHQDEPGSGSPRWASRRAGPSRGLNTG